MHHLLCNQGVGGGPLIHARRVSIATWGFLGFLAGKHDHAKVPGFHAPGRRRHRGCPRSVMAPLGSGQGAAIVVDGGLARTERRRGRRNGDQA